MAVLTSVVLWADTEDFFCQEAKLKKPVDASIPAYSLLADEIQLPVRHPQEVNSPTHIRGRPQVH